MKILISSYNVALKLQELWFLQEFCNILQIDDEYSHGNIVFPFGSHQVSESAVQILAELWQPWCHDHFSGELVSVPDQPQGEESFPNTQPRPPLTQLHAVPRALSLITRAKR